MDAPAIATDRLDLHPVPAVALEALIAGDADRLDALTGARFARPLVPPPLMADALPFMLERVREEAADARWWTPWLLRRREDGAALGMAGFAGPPDADGAVVLGYCVYPAFERNGYASEAARGLVAWALAQPGVSRVRATVPPDHGASRRVAERAGMRVVGTAADDEVGAVLVYEVGRDVHPDAPPQGSVRDRPRA